MGTNNFLKKLAKYDGVKYLQTSLKKLAVPLADELVEKGIPPMVRVPHRNTEILPKVKKFIEDFLQGDIRNKNREYFLSLSEEEKNRYLEASSELSSDEKENLSIFHAYVMCMPQEEEDREYKRLSRFHQAPKYKRDLIRYFADFPVPVYVIPVFQGRPEERINLLKWEEALPILEQTDLDLVKIKEKLEKKETIVIFSESYRLIDNFWPSAWILFHAIFDVSGSPSGLENFYNEIVFGYKNLLRSLYTDKDYWADDYDQKIDEEHIWYFGTSRKLNREIAKAITSKAGRPGGFIFDGDGSDSDLLAEMLTQAATIGKCTLNLESADTAEAKKRLKQIQDWVNSLGIRERLVNSLLGNIVEVGI